MKKYLFFGAAVGLVLALITLINAGVFTTGTRAGGTKYIFTARGVITQFDEANKTIKVDITKAEGKNKSDLEGTNREFIVKNAKVVKQVNGKDVRVTYHNFVIGQEVGVKGAAKDDDTFDISFARIHDRAFTVVGLLEAHNKTTKTLKILVTTSTYKPSTYKKGTEITMSYTDDSKFKNTNGTSEVSFSDLNTNDQKVKLTGTIENSGTWKVKTLIDGYTGK